MLRVWDPDGVGPLPPRLMVGGWNLLVPGTSQTTSMLQYVPATNTWSAVAGAPNDRVMAFAEAPNRSLIVGGQFTAAGSVGAQNIARMSTTGGWSALGGGLPSGWVQTIAVYPNGDIAAGGQFVTATIGGAVNISRFNGTSWAPWFSSSTVFDLALTPQGTLLVAGEGGMGGFSTMLAFTDGTSWTNLGNSSCGYIHTIKRLASGEYLLGGSFYNPFNTNAHGIARLSANGSTFSALGQGLTDPNTLINVFAIEELAGLGGNGMAGQIIAGGTFIVAGTQSARYVARWTGSAWQPMGAGMAYPSYFPRVNAVAELPDGRIAVGGFFATAGGVASPGLAFWTPTEAVQVTQQPTTRTIVCPGMAASFGIAATGSGAVAYQWQAGSSTSQWVSLTGAAQPLSCGGASAASATMPTGASTSVLLVPCTRRALATTMYVRCQVSNSCGPVNTSIASVVHCPADFNCSGGLSAVDLFEFLGMWFAGDDRADMNATPGLSVQDIFDFVAGWFAGC